MVDLLDRDFYGDILMNIIEYDGSQVRGGLKLPRSLPIPAAGAPNRLVVDWGANGLTDAIHGLGMLGICWNVLLGIFDTFINSSNLTLLFDMRCMEDIYIYTYE